MPRPLHFAWVDADETTFDPDVHNRWDEEIIAFEMGQEEGKFPYLKVTVRNPYVGLLSVDRKLYAWFGRDDDGTAVGEFFGRLLGTVDNIFNETVEIKFTSEPEDYDVKRHDYAQGLKVRPYYDPVFLDVNVRDDPDAILEAYPALWHVDRKTGEVTISNIIEGEDGVEEFLASEVPKNSLDMRRGDKPITTVSMEASVSWAQASTGYIDFGTRTIMTLSGEQLLGSWPKTGASLGGGWSVHYGKAIDYSGAHESENVSFNLSWQNTEKTHAIGDTMSWQISSSGPSGPTANRMTLSESHQIGYIDRDPDNKDIQPAFDKYTYKFLIGPYQVKTALVLRYDAGRDRSEKIRVTLTSDLQEIVTQAHVGIAAQLEVETIEGADVALPVQGFNFITRLPFTIEGPPIVDPQRITYFPTERGLWSVEHIISVLRARLMYSARCVTVSWDCHRDRIWSLSCRKSAAVNHPKIPGGVAEGKIIAYKITGNGPTFEIKGNVTIGCAIGREGHAAEGAGTPDYVADGYVAVGYQTFSDQVTAVTGGDIAYTIPVNPTNTEGMTFPLTKAQVVLAETFHNTWQSELLALQAAVVEFMRQARAIAGQTRQGTQYLTFEQMELLQKIRAGSEAFIADDTAVWYDLQLKPIDREGLEATYEIDTTLLSIKRGIDLGSATLGLGTGGSGAPGIGGGGGVVGGGGGGGSPPPPAPTVAPTIVSVTDSN